MRVSEKLGRPLAPGERCFSDGTLMTEDQIIELALDEDRPDHHRFWAASSFFGPEVMVGDVAEWLEWSVPRALTAAVACEETGLLRKKPSDAQP